MGHHPALSATINAGLAQRGWTQRDLETASGVPDETIRRLRDGEVVEPRPSVLIKIGNALGVDYWELLVKIAVLQQRVPSARALDERTARLSEKQRAALINT